MIYVVTVTKAGAVIFTHDILLNADRSFADDISEALQTFRTNYPGILLIDEDVDMSITKKP